MQKIVFVLPALNDSHHINHVKEFIERGYDVDVYGYERVDRKKVDYGYTAHVLAEFENASYKNRIKQYVKDFRMLGSKYKNSDAVFFLSGLDLTMFFVLINPKARYIYEEFDLRHTYMPCTGLLEMFDKRIIRNSVMTALTSGGFIDYHFGGKCPENVALMENKLNPSITEYSVKPRVFDKEKLSIGFVGGPRYDSVYNFIDVFCRRFPNYEFHVFGGPILPQFEQLRKYKNCFLHGFFKNPMDLPDVYGSIDLVLATYDVKYENVKYAEPNKIYESIYFETPIIVSSGTFLAKKVKRLGIGYDVNAMNEEEVVAFVKNLNEEDLSKKRANAKAIEKRKTLNINDDFFAAFEKQLKNKGK